MSRCTIIAAAASVLIAAGMVATDLRAADLHGHGPARTACLVAAERNDLLAMPASELLEAMEFRYNRAVATANEPMAINSNRPTFLWALETRQACAAAIGYLRGGAVENDYVTKCDCFHDRMIGHFR